MKKFMMIACVILALFLIIPMSASALINGSFEDGSLGWTYDGNVFFSPFPVDGMPTDGGAFVQLNNGFPGGEDVLGGPNAAEIEAALGISGLLPSNTYEGSYIYQEIYVQAGSTLSFDYNFFTNEDYEDELYDIAFVSLGSASGGFINLFADNNDAFLASNVGGYENMTGLTTFSAVSSVTGTYKLGFGIIDTQDEIVQSAIYLDNVVVSAVPEPSTIALFSVCGLLGVAIAWRRRQRA